MEKKRETVKTLNEWKDRYREKDQNTNSQSKKQHYILVEIRTISQAAKTCGSYNGYIFYHEKVA